MTTISIPCEDNAGNDGMPRGLVGFASSLGGLSNGRLAKADLIRKSSQAIGHVAAGRIIQSQQVSFGDYRLEIEQATLPETVDLIKDWLPPYGQYCDIWILTSTKTPLVTGCTVSVETSFGTTDTVGIPTTPTQALEHAVWTVVQNVEYGLGIGYAGKMSGSLKINFDGFKGTDNLYLYGVKVIFPPRLTIEV